MPGIGIIHNPFAKGNLKRPWIGKKLANILEDVGVFRETKDIHELPQVAQEFMDQGIEIMAVNGGDGTLHLALSAFAPVYGDKPMPKLLSLRGGTMNTVSNSLKIKGKTMKILEKAVQKYKAGEDFHEMDQHLIKVNEKYGFLTGAGVMANFLDAYYSGSTTGPWQATKMITRLVGSAFIGSEYSRALFAPAPMKITVDGKELDPDEFRMILGCTIVELGLGFKPTPRAYDKPGHFHFVAGTVKPISLATNIHNIYMGKDIYHKDIQSNGPVANVVIEPVGKNEMDDRWRSL